MFLWSSYGEDGGGRGGSEVLESKCWVFFIDLGRKVGVFSYYEL